jgi:hypothetical protein
MLAAQYDLAAPLSERLENLLKRFENTDEFSAGPATPARWTRFPRADGPKHSISGDEGYRQALLAAAEVRSGTPETTSGQSTRAPVPSTPPGAPVAPAQPRQ